ncbi:MAG: hypothetical protein EXQ86_09490 [Rhodospirillales bacterium]|nr:hypothetical protein [Rhodospirillales bacterium]
MHGVNLGPRPRKRKDLRRSWRGQKKTRPPKEPRFGGSTSQRRVEGKPFSLRRCRPRRRLRPPPRPRPWPWRRSPSSGG